ncbi:MAG: alpha-1,2-fucosyltransferase [Bacteroidales bacterium]|nr:alpha-1,2-fucosyltransferase [Bacteroidales bacterium]
MAFVVKISSGLGNQMSQYAFGQLLQHLYPEADVRYHIACEGKIHNGYELGRIFPDIQIQEADAKELRAFGIIVGWRRLSKICRLFKQRTYIRQVYETRYPVDERVWKLDIKQNYYFQGTWHNYDYSEILPRLRRMFKFDVSAPIEHSSSTLSDHIESSSYSQKIESTNSVAIHIRRGDFVKMGYAICDDRYYKRAIDMIESKVENPFYFIFSDDTEYAGSLFSGLANKEIVTGNTGEKSYLDMYLMSLCKHNIMANSTFSYWAALLNKNEDKIIIRPKMQTPDREAWEAKGVIKI